MLKNIVIRNECGDFLTANASGLPFRNRVAQTTAPPNLRSAPCGQVRDVIPRNTFLVVISDKKTVCTINGVSYAFQEVSLIAPEIPGVRITPGKGYIASKYLYDYGQDLTSHESFKVTAGALNVRTSPCGSVKFTVPFGKGGMTLKSVEENLQTCTINGRKYIFIKVRFTVNGSLRDGYVALKFIETTGVVV